MRDSTVQVVIVSRNGKSMGTYDVSLQWSVPTFKAFFQSKQPKYHPDRMYFTIGDDPNKITLRQNSLLSEYPIKNGSVITFKYLGMQIAWRTVFMIEYFGPILMHTLCFGFPNLVYGQSVLHNATQNLAYWLVIFHYVKRELETVFVHRFSLATMPAFNLVKNCTHYWFFGGISIAYFLYHPQYRSPYSSTFNWACAIAFIAFQLGNLHAHLTLRNLRPEGTGQRGIPRGDLFELVSCANYTYELGAWLAFCLFTKTLTAYLFLLISFVQISLWALKKHHQYNKEFNGYRALKRKALIPFVL